jgi:hypothetical protein
VLNLRNLHYWSVTSIANQQHRLSLNVWAGIFQNSLIGPFFIPNRRPGGDAYYLNFLQTDLENVLDELSLQQRSIMRYMRRGASLCTRPVVEYLNNKFPERWVAKRGPFP